ncbi:LamG-like jellyroll fold domain-containing protein [Phaeovulum sp.]|uniref:LamG-like jellyroll fold domain-containing protein n=1 Tax=Phaeovulum sp. TaxID=2934796 RepID=UPI0039E4A48D
MSKASGGDTILLSSGNYGSLNLKNLNFDSYVTLKSADANHEAQFSSLKFENSSHLRVDNVHVDSPSNGGPGSWVVQVYRSNHIEFINSEVNGLVDKVYDGHYGIHVKESDYVTLDNNNVHDIGNGILGFGSDHLTVKNNSVDYVYSDFFKFGGVHDVVIENNDGGGHLYPGPKSHADFMQFQAEASDVVIRGNTFLSQSSERAQGIFLDDAVYNNITIEDNIIYSGKLNAILVSDGSGITVRDNTVLSVPNLGHKAAAIRVPSGSVVENNITSSYEGGTSGSNIVAQWDDVKDVNHYNTLFKNADAGLGITLEDLRPVAGSAAIGKGAYGRLMELLDGKDHSDNGASTPPVTPDPVEPAPTPEVTPPTPEPDTKPDTTPDTDTGTDTGTGPDTNTGSNTSVAGAAFWMGGAHEISGKGDVINVKATDALHLDSATIALTFNADVVSGSHGILSKDAYGYAGGGNHFTSYIQNGTLHVRFQDGASEQIISVKGIQANTDYDLQVSFGDGAAQVWLDGTSVGTAAIDTSWVNNNEYMQIGANGWASGTGQSDFTHVFDGTISDVVIVEGVKSPAEMDKLLSGQTDDNTTADNSSTVDPAPVDPAPVDPTPVDPAPVDPAPTDPTPTDPTPEAGPESSLAPVFSLLGDSEFNGKVGSVVSVDHDDSLELSQGTIAFSFEADSVKKLAGLVSKDAWGYEDGGNHLSIYIKNGTLYARFQDDDSDAILSASGLKANTHYDVAASFDDDEVSLYLNGKLVDSDSFTMDWSHNDQVMQIGGLGWASHDGSADASDAFDGTISDFAIYDHALNAADGNFFA